MKKFTKILSLALALALVLSTTAFAATTVYYTQDFSAYPTITDLHAVVPSYISSTHIEQASVARYYMANNDKLPGAPRHMMARSTGSAQFISGQAKPAFSTDASDIKWLAFATNSGIGNQSAKFIVVPTNTWDYTAAANQDQTYVVSFDVKADCAGSTGTYADTERIETMWTDGTEWTPTNGVNYSAGNAADAFTALYRPLDGTEGADTVSALGYYNAKTSHDYDEETGELIKENYNVTALADNTKYNMAVGYKYDAEKDYPVKQFVIDGTVISESDAAGNATSATSKLAAVCFNYSYTIASSIANLKMYTIGNSDTLDVSRVGNDVVPTSNASINVKFSQPVGSIDKTKVAIEGLTYGKDFTVTDVKDVVTETEVYSTATVNITANLEGDTEYTITFGDVKNEIGTAITGKTVSFRTMKAPTYILNIDGYEGLTAGTTEIAADAMAGKTVYFTVTATNDTGRATSGALAIGIYEGENLVKYAFANKAFADAGVNTFSAAFKLEAGQTAKAFVTGSNSVVTYQ